MNPSDTGFVIICAAFVLFMTPGLAFFYGGLGRRKNVISDIVKRLCGLRVTEREERMGLDFTQHGERAYPSFNGLDVPSHA